MTVLFCKMDKFLLVCLSVALIGSALCAEVPSYVKICGRKNPKLNECVKNSVESLRAKLREGMPEFETPSVEPLEIPAGIDIAESEAFRATARNVKIYGVSDFEIRKNDLNLEKKTLDIDLYFKKLHFEGDYNVSARIIVPINAVGPIVIDAEDILGKASLTFDFKNRKDGPHMMFTSMKCKITIGDYESRYITTQGQDSTLAEAVNSVLNGSKQEIISSISSSIEKATSEKILDVANKISKAFTYDQLLPDRE
ncbi:uncharacterized protein LOC107036053 [Diachasma alloeum]|uniref:uncharacterized protein LOC107036053 n=1 Tax=Diachasma alloeum TaxID=454923 RepID=UPI00073844F0|nr:uncharacterized protein LOC107036053 [Diachasma alloeum]